MEKKENKRIADKINSLDSLPKGYEPNLDAKWDLLQAAVEKKEKPFLLLTKNRWLQVAACLILCLVGSILWINKPGPKNADGMHAIKIIKPEVSEVTIPSVKENSLKKSTEDIIPTVAWPKKKRTIRRAALPVTSQTLAGIIPDSSLKSNDQINDVMPQVLAVEVKNKRQRYMQMDFDENVVKPPEKNTVAQTFHFRLGFRNTNSSSGTFQDNVPVKLKQNF
jgi:hypothetical protein